MSRSHASRRAVIALCVALATLGGLPGAQAAEKVTVGALRFTSHAPTFIAKERGYFAKEGLDVEIKFFQAAQPVAVAIASGDIDFGVTALTGGFFSLADKGALKVIGGLYSEKRGYPGMAILASNKAHAVSLTNLAKLKGHSWAMTQIGSSFHYAAALIGEANGFGLTDLALKPLQKVGAMIGAVSSGQVDAMAMVPHVAAPLAKAGKAKVIGQLADIAEYQVTTIFTSTKNIEAHADKVRRFMRAYSRAIADYQAAMLDQKKNPAATDAMVKLIHKYVYAERPYEKAAGPIRAGAVYMNTGGAIKLADVAAQLAWFKANRLAPATLDMPKLVDTRFAEIIR